MNLLLSLSFLFLNFIISAQEIIVKGTVTDDTGLLLPGANIIQKGTSKGVVTNFDGEFEIQVPPEAILEIGSTQYIDWRKGKLSIRKASFEEVIDKLEKWYGVHINVTDGLKIEGRYNGEFDSLSLESVLKGLSFSQLFDFEINGKIVTLKTKKNGKN